MQQPQEQQNQKDKDEKEAYVKSMAREHANDSGTVTNPLLLATSHHDDDNVTTCTVSFGGGGRYQGYLASSKKVATEKGVPAIKGDDDDDDVQQLLPCLIVIHEWWGLNAQIQTATRQLARQLPCHALAVDLYDGKPAAEDVKTARKYMKACLNVNNKEDYCMDCLQQAVRYCQTELAGPKLGVIGWCLGGMFALDLALARPQDLDACVVYYGKLQTQPQVLQALQAAVLGIFGSADRGIPLDTMVQPFQDALESLHKVHEIHIYDGAPHAFCNPTGKFHHPEYARDAWNKTIEFLTRYLVGK